MNHLDAKMYAAHAASRLFSGVRHQGFQNDYAGSLAVALAAICLRVRF